jgi:hypothetical protein
MLILDAGMSMRLVKRRAMLNWERNGFRSDPDGERLYFESLPVGAGVAGGMGGGTVTTDIWVHADLRSYEPAIRSVLKGERASIKQ